MEWRVLSWCGISTTGLETQHCLSVVIWYMGSGLGHEVLWGALLCGMWFFKVLTHSCKSFEQNKMPLHFWKILYKILSIQELMCLHVKLTEGLSSHKQVVSYIHTRSPGASLHYTGITAAWLPPTSATLMPTQKPCEMPQHPLGVPQLLWQPLPCNSQCWSRLEILRWWGLEIFLLVITGRRERCHYYLSGFRPGILFNILSCPHVPR